MSPLDPRTEQGTRIVKPVVFPTFYARQIFQRLNPAKPPTIDKLLGFLKGSLPTSIKSEILVSMLGRNLADMPNMVYAMKALESGPLNLPGGGILEHIITDGKITGVKISGPVNLAELEKVGDGKRGFFNLNNLVNHLGHQNADDLSIIKIAGNGFGVKKIDVRDLLSTQQLPSGDQAALTLFAVQFIPEFHDKYKSDRGIGLRTRDGLNVYAYRRSGIIKSRRDRNFVDTGVVALAS